MSADAALLIHRYLDGSLEEHEAREFNDRVRSDPAFRSLLAKMSYDAVALRDLMMPAESEPAVRPPAGPRRSWAAIVPLAAAAAVLVGIAVMLFAGGPPSTGFLSGRVDEVNGRIVVREAAVYRFAGGATAELERSTEAILRGDGFDLIRGGGRFNGTHRVGAPGMTVIGSDFRVELRGESVLVSGGVDIDRDGILTRSKGEVLLRPEKRGAANLAWAQYDLLLSASKLTLAEAIAIATRGGGTPVHAELEREDGVTQFNVELTTRDVEIDSANGRILEEEGGAHAAPKDAIALSKGLDIALRALPGRAVEAEYDGNRIDVKIVFGDRLVSVELDARTGAVLNQLIEDDRED